MIAGADDSYTRQSLPSLRDLKLQFEEMDAASAAKRWRQISFDAVTKVYFEHEGGYLLATHACEAVARELVRIGGTYRQVAVTSIRVDGQRPDVRLSDGPACTRSIRVRMWPVARAHLPGRDWVARAADASGSLQHARR